MPGDCCNVIGNRAFVEVVVIENPAIADVLLGCKVVCVRFIISDMPRIKVQRSTLQLSSSSIAEVFRVNAP